MQRTHTINSGKSPPLKLLTVAMVSALILVMGAGLYAYSSHHAFAEDLRTHFKFLLILHTLDRRDVKFNLVLKMPFAPFDETEQESYLQIDRDMIQAINKAIQIAPDPELQEMFVELKKTNDQLVQMEQDAFETSARGRIFRGRPLSINPSYTACIQSYGQQVKYITEELKQRREVYQSVQQELAYLTMASAILAIPLLVLSAYLLRLTRSHTIHHKTTEDRLQAILDNSLSIVYVRDLEGRYLLSNRHLEELFGRPREQVVGKTLYDFFPKEHADRLAASDREIIEGGKLGRMEEQIPHATRSHTYHSIKFPLHDAKGNVYAVCGISTDVTARKEIELSLQESEERFREMAESIKDVFWVMSLGSQPQILYLSPAYEEIWGRDPQDLYDDPESGMKAVHPDDREGLRETQRAELQTGRLNDVYRIVRPDGTIRWIHDRGFPICDESGQPVRSVGIAMDITELKHAEEALRTSEAWLQKAQQVAHVGSWEADFRSEKRKWSDETYRILGYAPQAFPASETAFLSTIHPDDLPMVERKIAEALRGESPYDFDHRIVRPDGAIRHLHEQAEITRDDQGEPIRMTGTVLDITDRKHAEIVLRKERDFTETTLNTLEALVMVLDTDEKVVRFNRSCERTSGYAFDAVKGRKLLDLLVPEEELDAVKAVYAQLRAGQFPDEYEHHWITCNGNRRRIAWAITALTSTCGTVDHIIATGIDVTERRQSEEALRRAERLAVVGTLAGGVAHEFNNIHQAIITNLDLLLRGKHQVNPTLRSKLERIHKATWRAAEITDNLLSFSRHNGSAKREASLNEVVEDTLAIVDSELSAKGIEVDLCMETISNFVMDAAQIGQAVMNLIINAHHAMLESPTKQLTIQTGYDQEHAFIRVIDTGCGIPKEHFPQLFDPFFTTKGEHSQPGHPLARVKGTGLGLSVTNTILDDHNGKITVESKIDEGTTFTITLPMNP